MDNRLIYFWGAFDLECTEAAFEMHNFEEDNSFGAQR